MKSDAKWEESRKMGRLKYSVLHGFSFAILFSLMMLAWDAFENKISLRHTTILMLLNFIVWGVIEYFLIWPLSEKHYQKKK